MGTLAHAFWVRVSFPEVQSLVEVGRTDVQIAWPFWELVFSALLKRTATTTQAGAGSQTLRFGTVQNLALMLDISRALQ